MAALQGTSMREYIQETLKAIADVENEKDLVKAEDVLDLFDKLDI